MLCCGKVYIGGMLLGRLMIERMVLLIAQDQWHKNDTCANVGSSQFFQKTRMGRTNQLNINTNKIWVCLSISSRPPKNIFIGMPMMLWTVHGHDTLEGAPMRHPSHPSGLTGADLTVSTVVPRCLTWSHVKSVLPFYSRIVGESLTDPKVWQCQWFSQVIEKLKRH